MAGVSHDGHLRLQGDRPSPSPPWSLSTQGPLTFRCLLSRNEVWGFRSRTNKGDDGVARPRPPCLLFLRGAEFWPAFSQGICHVWREWVWGVTGSPSVGVTRSPSAESGEWMDVIAPSTSVPSSSKWHVCVPSPYENSGSVWSIVIRREEACRGEGRPGESRAVQKL